MTNQDAEFGSMQFDGYEWVLEQYVPFNGATVPIRIEPEDSDTREISPVQRQAIQQALAISPEAIAAAAPVVLQNYDVYRDMIGDEELPPLQDPVDVWQQVTPSYISVPAHGSVTVPTFLLMAECDWDPEHGLSVRFRNGYADAANQQGELDIED